MKTPEYRLAKDFDDGRNDGGDCSICGYPRSECSAFYDHCSGLHDVYQGPVVESIKPTQEA